MKVRFTYPMGSQGWDADVDLDVIPRVGEQIDRDETEYTVRTVVHYPFDDPQMVYVVVR